ncbi:MAG: hypothetical protein H0W89_03295 [Candidatus Levybacteria bacterium]|nr:hypothetical protein [Candidatus Levybacteria bacterium]
MLSETHPVGKSKAVYFRNNGFNQTNVAKLEHALLAIAWTESVTKKVTLPYGNNYQVDGKIKTPLGSTIHITTVWFIKTKGRKPSFVTAYPV